MSFLNDYREYTAGNESPPTYHLFCSLVALSSIVSRRVWVDLGYFKIYPNLYVVLVGPPGAKKSTAISIARGLLHALKSVPFSGECTSKEKLILDMVDNERAVDGLADQFAEQRVYTPLTVMASELSEFFQISGDGMVGLLTDLFDIQFPYEHKTKNKGSVIINGPYLCVLAGTTPSWMTSYLKQDIITGGFTRRCLFVYESEPGPRRAFPVITGDMRAAWFRVFQAAERLSKLRGPFTWTDEAKAWYTHWYETHERPKDENTTGYYETRHVQLIKLAMLFAISEDEVLELRLNHFLAGLEFLRIIEVNLGRVFEGMGRNDLNAVATKVLDVLRRGAVAKVKQTDGTFLEQHTYPAKKLLQIIYPELPTNVPDAFEKILTYLASTDRIQRVTISTDGASREVIILKEKV